MKQRKLIQWAVMLFAGLMILLTISSSTFLTIDPGERGVIFRRFSGGLDKDKVYTPGFHVIAPWNTMYVYSVREAQVDETMTVLSSNGLNIKTDITVRVHPIYNELPDLHEKFGIGYGTTLVIPEVRSVVRNVIGKFEPEELYSSKRDEVQQLIVTDLQRNLKNNHVELRAALIRDIELPEKIRTAIERKLQQEQESEEYRYRLEKERQEAERKIIEANANAEANRILSASLTEKILKDKAIDATLELANSPNSKVVVVGSGKDGLPIILGNQ